MKQRFFKKNIQDNQKIPIWSLKPIAVYLSGFPLLNPKLELTIIATQKAMKMTRNTTSLHFLLCFMIPPVWALPSLDGYLPITAPKELLIITFLKRERESEAGMCEV